MSLKTTVRQVRLKTYKITFVHNVLKTIVATSSLFQATFSKIAVYKREWKMIYPKLQSVYVGAAIQTTRQSLLETTITGSKNPTTRRPEYKQAYIIGSQHFVFSCCCCEVLKHEYCAAVYIQILCDAACFPFGTFDVSLSASLTFVGIKWVYWWKISSHILPLILTGEGRHLNSSYQASSPAL